MAACKEYLHVRQEGAREVAREIEHYNLEAILAVGYRVRSDRGTQFRRWATERMREYLIKGNDHHHRIRLSLRNYPGPHRAHL